jgi:DNA-binding response OmpR family regulator
MRERQRILIVEDDYLLASLLAEVLDAAGWQVVGPVGHLAEALETVASEDFDAAVLDVNLGGQTVYPVAEVLEERNVPFAFLTGYGPETLPRSLCERPRLGKPLKMKELVSAVARLTAPAAAA